MGTANWNFASFGTMTFAFRAHEQQRSADCLTILSNNDRLACAYWKEPFFRNTVKLTWKSRGRHVEVSAQEHQANISRILHPGPQP